MIKVISFLKGRVGSGAPFVERYLDDVAPRLLSDPRTLGLTVNAVVAPPAKAPFPTSTGEEGEYALYDIIVERWHADVRDKEAVDARDLSGNDLVALRHEYRVTETTIVNALSRNEGVQTPGMKFMGRLMFHEDLPDSAARRSWGNHAKVALRVHVGMNLYLQNWVEEVLSPDTPASRGMPQLMFPTVEDLTDRFFDSERGRQEIASDTSHFVQSGRRFYCTELPLRIAA